MRTKILEAVNITVIYPNGVRANDNISISVNEGEILGLLGENGAGKTTLVKVISGIIKP
ncbi:MAG: ATP-binding cassette domain-containing protein, partial [Acidilobaceae archaeon]